MHAIKFSVVEKYGKDTAEKVMEKMTNSIRKLEEFPVLGVSVKELYDVDTDYMYLYTEHNYAFYRIEGNIVRIVDIYNEKEDFILSLFGTSSIFKESEDYWGE